MDKDAIAIRLEMKLENSLLKKKQNKTIGEISFIFYILEENMNECFKKRKKQMQIQILVFYQL